LMGAAVFGRPATSRIIGAALIGAMLPDLSEYLMVGYRWLSCKFRQKLCSANCNTPTGGKWCLPSMSHSSSDLGCKGWQCSTWAIASTGAALVPLTFPLYNGAHVVGISGPIPRNTLWLPCKCEKRRSG
jgi:hypothetical protein